MAPPRFRALAILAIVASACGPITEEESASPPANCATAGHAIEPFKELVVVEDSVMTDASAKNGVGGVLSFRTTMERLAPHPENASVATLAWLDQWAPASIRCAWLRDRVENACDATCGTCVERHIDLARAPFRLIAIANRIDLSEPTAVGAGEGRLLFAATDGPGDDPRSPSLPVTAIFEFRLGGDRGEWASRWHALGAHRAFDAHYIQSLTDVTERFVRAEDLAQVRVNDAASVEHGVMLEFHLDTTVTDSSRRLVQAGLRRTPTHSIDGSQELRDFVSTHRDDILADRYELPGAMLTTRVEIGTAWSLPGIDEPLRHAFAGSTCDGCHGKEHPTTDGGFHISPHGHGVAKLSRFLFDPDHREDDELTRRAGVLTRFACAP